MSRLVFIKNIEQLQFVRDRLSGLLQPDIWVLTTCPHVWFELSSAGKRKLIWAGDFAGGNDWELIEEQALNLRDSWFGAISPELFYEGINLAELIRLEHTCFFRNAIRSQIIIGRVLDACPADEVIVIGRCQTPCCSINRSNNNSGVFDAVLLWEAQKRGIKAGQIPFESSSPQPEPQKPQSMSEIKGRVFAFDCWEEIKSSKLIAVGASIHLIILEPFVRAWNRQAGREGLLLNSGKSIQTSNKRAGFKLPPDIRFANLADFSTCDQSPQYVQAQRCLQDAFNHWTKSRGRSDDADIFKNPYLDFQWTSIWNSLVRLPLTVQKASEAIRIMQPDVVLTDEMASAGIRVFTEVAKKNGILTVECPHGYVGDIEEFQPHGDLYLAWGAETIRQLNQRFRKDNNSTVVTGSGVNEKIIKSHQLSEKQSLYQQAGLCPNKKTVCVVTRYIFGHIWPVNIKEFLAGCEQIALLARNQDVQIIIKVSPRADHTRLYERIFDSYDNVHVCSEYPLDELLPVIDIGVMFFYTGTASLLFLHRDIPTIFILNKNTVRYTDTAWRVFEDNEPLSELCHRFLYNTEARRQRLEMQKAFAQKHLYIDDNDVTARAASTIKDTLDKSHKKPLTSGSSLDKVPRPAQTNTSQIETLAIFTPQVGAVSETFIARQINGLAPGRTVLVTQKVCDGAQVAQPCLVIPPSGGITVYHCEVERQVVQFLTAHNVTHILCQYGCHNQSIVELNRRRLGLPIFVHFLGYDASKLLRNPEMVRYYRWMGRNVTGVIALCKTMAVRLAAVGIAPQKIHVIPHGVEIPQHIESQPQNQPCRFISVIRFVPKKGPLLLLRAFEKVHECIGDCTLDIIGDGPLRQEVESFIQSHRLSSAVKLHGFQPHEYTMAIIYNSSVYVQHSITEPETGNAEGLPHIILEAAAAGLPVVSTLHEGICDEVLHGTTGFLVKEGDVDAMAQYMTRLAQDQQMRKTMGTAGYKKIAAEFNLPLWMQRLRSLLTSSNCNDPHGTCPKDRNDKAKVSVIMSCYNSEKFLPEALDSILAQTMPRWELLCLDDGSTDNTKNIIAEYAAKDERIKPQYFDDNKGPYVRRNFAINRAESNFIMVHDADDIMLPDKLARLYNEIIADPNLGIVGAGYLNFADRFRGAQFTEKYEFPAHHADILDGLLSGRHTICHASCIIRKELFDAVGLYDENRFGADAFWLAKVGQFIRLTGRFKLKNIPQFLMLRRIHLHSQSCRVGIADPRSERRLYKQYYSRKLQDTIRNLDSASPDKVGKALKSCDCSDFPARFSNDIAQLKAQPVDLRVVTNLASAADKMFSNKQYVSCISAINNAEAMYCDFAETFKNADLVRAMSYVALDMKPESLKYLDLELQNHANPAAKRFQADYFERQSHTDVHQWYLDNENRYDMRIAAAKLSDSSDDLSLALSLRGWDKKLSLYQKYFEHVTRLREPAAPVVSVIIISWRFNPDTVRNFESLTRRRTADLELIFVDNGAAQGEFDRLKPFIDTYIRLNQNTGAYLARNIGAVFANGSILLFIDDDGICAPDIVQSYRLAFEKYDAVAVRGAIRPIDPNAPPYKPNLYYGPEPFPYFSCQEGNTAYLASVFYQAAGWDDEIILGGAGLDLSRRLLDIVPDMRKQIYWPEAVLYHGRSEMKENWDKRKSIREASIQRLKRKHPDFGIFQQCYKKYLQRQDLLIPKGIEGATQADTSEPGEHLYHNQELFKSFRLKCQDAAPSPQVLSSNDKFGELDAFKAAIEANPNCIPAHNGLGRLYYEMGDFREAMRCFTNAFRLNPADHGTISNICRLYKRMGWTKEARALMQKCLPNQSQTGHSTSIVESSDNSLQVQVIGSEYGRSAVVLDLIPFGSTVISAGVGEDISFDLELISLKGCNIIAIDPTEKSRRYVEQNRNEHFHFLQKALCPPGNKTIRIYKNRNPQYVSDSITPHHHAVSPDDFYESQTVSLQDLLQEYNNISLLKMDIEGAEYPVLDSICDLDIPQIYVAFHASITNHPVSDTTGCIERLKQMGYVPVHRTGKLDGLIDILFVHKKCLNETYSARINTENFQPATY